MKLLQKPTIFRDRTRDLMVHLACTGCDKALCGAPLKGVDADDRDLDCNVCVEMEHQTCPTCGLS